jgi:hypothetical protein
MTDKSDIIRRIQERLLVEERVGEALAMTTDDLWNGFLTDEEQKIFMEDKQQLLEVCLYAPLRSLFEGVHRLNCLSNESYASRIFEAAVNDGAVSVIVGESVTPIVMDGHIAKMIDAFSLAELVDCNVDCVVDIGGMCICFHK